jgi:hypothetical protein
LFLGKEVAKILRIQRQQVEQEQSLGKEGRFYHADTSPDIDHEKGTKIAKTRSTPI